MKRDKKISDKDRKMKKKLKVNLDENSEEGLEENSTENEKKYIDLVMENKMIRRTKWILENKNTELRTVLHNRYGEICIGLQYKKIGASVPKDW